MPPPAVRRYFRHGMLPQIRVLEACARLGSFARAAEELHLSQPAASLQIKKLGETLGVTLYEQIGKRIHLTEAGERVVQTCRELFDVFGALDGHLASLRTLQAGRLRLAVSTTGMCFAPRLVGAFVDQHPGTEASVQGFNRQSLVERMAGNEDDLYLFADAPDMGDVVAQMLLPNPMVVLARDDHPLAQARRIPFERLAQEPFLLREEGSGARRILMQMFDARGLVPRVRMELGTNEAIKEAILSGLGIALMSRYTFGLDPESSRFICLDVEGFPLENHWYLAYPVGKQVSPLARAFLDFARQQARPLVSQSTIGPWAIEPG